MSTQPLLLPVDYYELLDLAPVHLFAAPEPEGPRRIPGRPFAAYQPSPRHLHPDERLDPLSVDEAAVKAERAVVADTALSSSARALRLAEIEIGRRILRDPARRRRYDTLRGLDDRPEQRAERLRRLRELQLEVRSEIAQERGEAFAAGDGASLLDEGLAALRGGDYTGARDTLRRAAELLPASAAAQLAYVRAALAATDPLTLGAFALRSLDTALAQALSAEPGNSGALALRRLVAGLLARESGDRYTARNEFEQAIHLQPNLAPAWRGLAAVHLADGRYNEAAEAAQRAFNADERDEVPLHILIVAARRARQDSLAMAAARRVAAMRGSPWTADRVLRELDS